MEVEFEAVREDAKTLVDEEAHESGDIHAVLVAPRPRGIAMLINSLS